MILGSSAKIKGDLPQKVIEELDEVCSYQPENYEYTQRYIKGSWDGWVHLFNKSWRSFPVGLLTNIKIILELNSISYAVRDARETKDPAPLRSNVVLRDYQEKILRRALELGSGIVYAPPGAGKTQLGIELTAKIGLPTLFIAPSEEIFYQTHERYKNALNQNIGLVGNGIFKPERISIATWQTISRGIKEQKKEIIQLLQNNDLLILDEVHHYSADEVYKVALYSPAKHRYGLTATPFRGDKAELKFYGACGDLIKVVTASDLIRKGYLVKPHIKFMASAPKFFPRWLKWQKIYSQGVVDNTERNALIAGEANKLVESGRTTLVLVTHVRHGQLLEKMIPGSVFVSSKASDRRDIVENFKAGKLKCVVSTPIWDEGLDVPVMDGLVLAGAGKSPVKAVQRVGRGLRPCNGKKDVRIVDVNDKGMRYLGEHSAERYKIYRLEEEFAIEGEIPEVV